ncbi:MAG: helix-turn-helix transcriptional regulator, partial [Candidatus Eremiobacteraeota bacterium]|nr:helix-turn-helix transcriptional regulator [Candidatus Eremiobacteraeota bacterium]
MNRSRARSGEPKIADDARTRTFSRDRLYARLDAARIAPVTLVVADEGLGKSTLIRDYLAVRAIPHACFAATPDHAAPGELLRGLAAALGAANPAMARSAGNAALQLERADGEAAALAWAREHLGGLSTTIVLDELHHVLAEPRCASFLSALVEATLPRIRWIVAVRDATSLPVPRWLASGFADLPIESGELRVYPDEIRAAFERAGFPLSATAAQALYERTGGWALGLSVALATGDLSVPSARGPIYDGLVDAAFDRFSGEDQDRVCELAAVGRFDASIVAALECEPALIERLRACRLVFTTQDEWHAFYEPCRARVQNRLDRFGEERRSVIFDRAAGALERAGRWRDALALRVRSADEECIAAALDRRGFSALDHGEVSSVGQALKSLCDETLARHPVALALNAALASLEESFDVSEAWFRMAIDSARDDQRREIVLRYGMDLVRRGRHDVVELLEAEAARGETRANPDADAALWALLGTAYVEAHRLDRAREAARRALARLPGVEDDGVRARVLHQASYVALNDGDPGLAKSLAERALTRADASFLYDLAARALSVLFNVAMLQDDDVSSAREALMRLEEAGRKAGSDGLRLYAILNAYSIEVDAGDTVALERLDRKLEEMQVLLTPTVSEALLPAQALCAAWDGRFSHAYDLLAVSAEKLFDEDRTAYRWAEIAVYAAAAGMTAHARAAIESSHALLRMLEREKPLAVRTAAYLALAETLLRNDAAAREAIAEAHVAAACANSARSLVLVEAVAAFYDCGTGGADAFLALGEALDALDRCDLRGVARFIGRLPVPDAGAQRAANRARRRRR